MIIFNPFYYIIETKYYPASRVIRTGFWQKIADTFYIFMGQPGDADQPEHLGLLAYASLFLLPLAYHFVYRVAPSLKGQVSRFWYNMAQFGAGILMAPILLPLGILAVGLTVASAPLIFVVNLITSSIRGYLENIVKENLEVKGKGYVCSSYTITQYLNREPISFHGDRNIDTWEVSIEKNHVHFSAREDFNNSAHFATHNFKKPLNASTERVRKNRLGLTALFKMNPCGVTEKLEREGFDFRVF